LVGDLAQQFATNSSKKYNAILDAGCGTGLAGRYLRPWISMSTGIMVGVDASQKMLDKAAACTLDVGWGLEPSSTTNNENSPPLYEILLKMDLEDIMTISSTLGSVVGATKQDSWFDLIVAADVFVYFGSLELILTKFAELSGLGAHLIFTTELALTDEAPLGWRLLESGRFAHTKQHVVKWAQKAGYELVNYQEIVPRMEKGEPVRGQLFGFQFSSSTSDKHVEQEL
jgi:predicted TPR repeat methyltransferase